MRVLVTGATGLVGLPAVAALRAGGHEVVTYVREQRPGPLDALGVEQVRGALGNGARLEQAMAACSAVVHCAAIYSYARDADITRTNVDGTRSVVAAAAAAGVARAVVVTSSVTCGSSATADPRTEAGRIGSEPVPAYFTSKVAQEQVALDLGLDLGLDVVIACPTVVLGGPTRRLVPSNAILLRYLLDATRSTFPGGCNVVDARDVGAGLALLATTSSTSVGGRRFLLGGENLSWRTLHSTIGDLTGIAGPYVEAPPAAAYLGSAAAELWSKITGGEALSTREEARTVGRYYWYDDAAARALGYGSGSGRSAIASGLAWLLAEARVPRWVREQLHVSDEVRRARPLVPRPLG